MNRALDVETCCEEINVKSVVKLQFCHEEVTETERTLLDLNIFHKVQAILISRDHFDINIKVAGRPIEATLIPQVTFSPGL